MLSTSVLPEDILLRALLKDSLNGLILYQVIRNEANQPVDFRYQMVNSVAAALLKANEKDLLNKSCQIVFPLGNELRNYYKQVVVTGQNLRVDYQLPADDRWFEVLITAQEQDTLLCFFTDITVRKQAQEELRLAHERLRTLFDAVPLELGFYRSVRDEHGQLMDLRPELINLQSVHRLQIPDVSSGQLMSEQLPGLTNRDTWPIIKQVIDTGVPQRHELYYDFIDGSRWFDVLYTRLEDGIISASTDISDRKQTEQELIKHLALLQQTEELAATGSWEYNQQTRQFTWSPGMYKLFGIEPDSLVAPDIFVAYAVKTDQLVARQIVDFLQTGTGQLEEMLCIQTPQALKIFQVKGRVMAGADDQTVRVLGVCWDITRQRQTQQQLALTVMNLQAVLDASPAFIAFLKASRNEAGQVTDFAVVVHNQKFAEFAHYPPGALVGLSIADLEPILWGAQTLPNLLKVLETGQPYYEEQLNDTRDRWLSLSVTKQHNGVVLTGLDITDLKQAQQQQQYWMEELTRSNESLQTLRQLRQTLRERGELLRATSHDLRGNFGVIAGAASMLTVVQSEDERRQMLEMLLRNVRQATQMLTELLDYARLEAGQEKRTITSFDAASLLMELSQSVRALAEQKELSLKIDGPVSLPVKGDALNVRRMAQNILLNAINYTLTGTIHLEWGLEPDNRWWFLVQDTGPGLTANLLANLNNYSLVSGENFQVQRGGIRAAGASETSGEGIGLRIVRQLGELLDARLTVQSEPGKGTRFLVSLPMQYT
ncbi:PAS domain-containing sensor histidine kinase [Spirosoma radiotolerans]|uniref:PAS domain-containing sensor histidine kinase n=1 Tax=Spirosoma radiotolerans TaxID=1379870 RepID=UPI00069917A0|nr:PAS domain-containing sensor histidine kinase [Spirosoma radiotolerans]